MAGTGGGFERSDDRSECQAGLRYHPLASVI
jgi:hypothetical protein